MKAAAIGVVAAVLVLVVRRNSPELGLMVSLAGCVLLGMVLVQVLSPVLTFFEQLRETAGLSSAVLSPLLKTVAIGLIAKTAAAVCADAGESALGSFVELCGTASAFYVALPLLSAVLELLKTLMEG